VFRMSFARDNLSYVVRRVENKMAELIHILQSVPGSVIVYVRSRRETREVARGLNRAGISADFFTRGFRGRRRCSSRTRGALTSGG